MKRYRFVHAADLHLDSPFRGLLHDAPRVSNILRDATFKTYEDLIRLCVEERVDALLVAGDIYDGADRSLRAQLRFVEGLRRLEHAGIAAFVCHGNHDPLDGWEANVGLPPNVVRFGPTVSSAPFDRADPASPLVHGVSYPTRDVRENLVPSFPRPPSGRFNIGLLHANVGSNTGHEAYAPCTLDDLSNSGHDYWALGHVHTRAILRERDPMVVYPGNPQGRHVNEGGERGVYLVEVDGQRVTACEFRPIDSVRWARVTLAIDELEGDDQLYAAASRAVEDARNIARGRALVYRLLIQGYGPIHTTLTRPGTVDDLRDHLNGQFASESHFAFCERIENESRAAVERAELRQNQDLLGDLIRLVDELRLDDGGLTELRTELTELYQGARTRRYLGDRALDALDISAVLADAEDLLVEEFLGERGA